MANEQVHKMDHLLEDDSFSLGTKVLRKESFVAEVRVKISENTVREIMKTTLGYGKHLACIKRHQSDKSKK